MSRAFGNRMLKQFVVAEPEIQVILDYCLQPESLQLDMIHSNNYFHCMD